MYKNYKIIKEQELKDINAFGTLLSHNKSGAKILLLKNDDENKSFCIGFRTPPYDDTGLPHILEHSVLCGSRKFPVKEPFVELMKSSLNTFLNAMTFPDKTIYPVASCNDQDFKNLMDVYMDAVLYPNIHIKEEIFKQEGWHYELDSKEGELFYNGVVYNEMKGAFSSPDGIIGRESLNTLFPDTAYGVESGGNPDFIPTLTYEKFKAFHKKYYHPSNCYITIYGNCDMEEVLRWLNDEYLSNFEKTDINSQLEVQKPFKKLVEKRVLYPVSEEQGVENKTLLAYNVALQPKMPNTDLIALEIIAQVLLQSAAAPLKKAILDEKIGDVVTGEFDSGILQPVFSILVKNTNTDQKTKFISVIENELKDYVKKGINRKAIEAAINIFEFKLREADFGGASKGLIYTINAYNTWLYDDNDPFTTFEYSNVFNTLRNNINSNYFEKIIEKYLINNTHKALVICEPSLEIQSVKEKTLKEKLNQYKNTLTNEQLEKIIEETKQLKAYQVAPDSKDDLDTIPLLKKEDLSYDIIPVLNKESFISNVKILHHNYQTNGIGYMRLLFNLENVPAKLLPYLSIFKSLLGSLNTNNHTYETLEQDILINTGGIKNIILNFKNDDQNFLYLSFEARTLYNKIDFTLNIINEMILFTDFDMKDRIKECLAVEISNLQQSLIGAGHIKSATRALSYSEENYYLSDMFEGIAYFDLLNDLMKNYDEKFVDLVSKLNQLCNYVFCKDNLLISFTGNNEGLDILSNNLNNFVSNLYPMKQNDDKFIFIPEQKNEGFKAPIDVNYVALAGNFKKAGLPFTGALYVLNNAISTDYLWKNVRVLGGAYGCMCGFNDNGDSYFISYRDPNLGKTLDVYKKVMDYLKKFEASEDEMIKFIIGAVGAYDFPKSPSEKGRRALISYLRNKTEEDYKLEKAQILDVTPTDIKTLVNYIEAIIDQNNICVIGNDCKIEEEKSIFKTIKNLLK